MIVNISRLVLMTAGALGGLYVSRLIDWTAQIGYPQYLAVLILFVLGVSMGYLLGSIFGRELAAVFHKMEQRLRETSPTDVVAGAAGLLVGLVVAWLLGMPLRLIEPPWLSMLSLVALLLMLGVIGMRIALIKSSDIEFKMPALSVREEGATVTGGTMKLLDTSAVIDGRLSTLRNLGVMEGDIRVPRFVLTELHTLADSADDIKRSRGRRGIDFLAAGSSAGEGGFELFEADYPEVPDVDGKLMRLAADTGGVIVTVDHNLTGVARAARVPVINLNEVATAMRPTHLPGERLEIAIVKTGKEPTQGVGYLEDGTMVVIAEGSEHVGRVAEVEVTSVLQTSSGRMVFARFDSLAEGPSDG